MADGLAHDLSVVEGQGRGLVRVAIGDAKPAAKIQPGDLMAIGAQGPGEFRHHLERGLVGGEICQLAADMHIDPDHFDARQIGRTGIDLPGARDRDAELVLGLAGGDLGMGLGVHVRVDADGDAGCAAHGGGDAGELFQLGLAFDIELADVVVEAQPHLCLGLADAGEDDPAARDVCGECTAHFAFGDHVHARTQPRQSGEHGLIGIGLHGVGDEMVHAGERFLEDPVVTLERGGGIDIGWRADLCRDPGQGHILGMQNAVAIGEMVHACLCPVNGASRRDKRDFGWHPTRIIFRTFAICARVGCIHRRVPVAKRAGYVVDAPGRVSAMVGA